MGYSLESGGVGHPVGLGQGEDVVYEAGPVAGGQNVRVSGQQPAEVGPVFGGVVDAVVAELTHVQLDPVAASGRGPALDKKKMYLNCY